MGNADIDRLIYQKIYGPIRKIDDDLESSEKVLFTIVNIPQVA